MKTDYPKANARLAEVAKSWADGEVSHEAWRKERRTIIESLLQGKDWLASESVNSTKRVVSAARATLPNIPAVPPFLAPSPTIVNPHVMVAADVPHEDVLLLAILLLVMMMTVVTLLYIL
ncbi:hypothetical protein [Agitococcus lubricus]|uniref:Uncharacterized protein n=1 Tax=Agitococcus lubricus TaxID=1077255 RepID=A0A2T5IYL7_9GAMM|nr:hypothetical protein [Agitococcus lubricus]PTQ89070.1 hypothetical protein C8N29_10991 [Agitococcus lubricus]